MLLRELVPVAIDAGVELNDLIGLVTALQQTTARGGAVIGNGLKTIFTRIQRPESIRQIEELGVSVRNLTGAVLPADKILLNMAKSFDKMTQAQQSNVVQFSAGIFQANVFRAALRDLAKDSSLYEQASRVAGDAAGEAALKNEKLNKTLAALASQSSSAVRELAGVLGDLMVKPELGTFMEGFVSTVEGLKNALGGGEEEGSTFAKGFVRGIGNILTGPGLLAFGAVFVKMLMNVGKFASQSIKDVLGIVDKKEKVRQMEEAIVKVLSQNKSIQEGLNELEGDRVAQERFMLKIIEAQTNAMVKQKQIASSLASPLLRSGINTDLTVDSNDFVDLDKNAKIDSFGAKGVIPRSTVHREKQGAMQAGYQPGPVDAMEVKGMGRVVYNKAETIKQFPGMDQPAIMPPSSSRAGKSYKKNFHKQHGFDPYSELSAEKYAGFIPNYAKVGLKNNVTENQERMHLKGTPYQNLPDYVLKDIGGAANLAGANIKFKVKTSSFTGKIGDIGKYLNALGVDHVETTIPFDFVDVPVTSKGKMTKAAKVGLTTGTTKQRGNYAEGQFLKSDAGKGYFSTAADDQAVVDGISESGAPTEVKAASIDLQNILSKSIRRYSNQKFRETLMSVVSHHKDVTRSAIPNNLLEGFSTNGEIADALSGSVAKLEEDSIVKNLSTLARMGQYTIPGMSPEEVKSSIQKQSFRQELLSRGIGQGEKDLLMKYGMSGGFIPNYRNFYQMLYGNDGKPAGITGGAALGARENWGHHHDYILSETQADAMLKDEFNRRAGQLAKSKNPGVAKQVLIDAGINNLYTRKYTMDDSDYAQFSSGVYNNSSATILSKILPGLPWTDGKSKKRSALGTKVMPLKLATIRSHPDVPFHGREALTFPDVTASSMPPSVTWQVQKKLNETFMKYTGMEQETIEEYLDEKDFIKLLAKSAGDREPEALRAGRTGGIQGVKDFIDETRMYKGYIPNFIKWHDRPGGGSKIPKPDNPGLFTKQEVEELKSMGYKRTDSHGWHYAKPVGLKHTPPTKSAPFGLAGPMSFDFLSRMIQHDRETYSIPNSSDDNPDLDTLGKSLTSQAGQKNPVIVGYDSTVNRMQLIEGNHRLAAIARLNKNRDKTQKFYSGIHGYVAGAKLRSQGDMDHSVGFVNQQIYPPKIPDDIVQAMKDPYRAPGQFVQGSWAPSDFGIPNFADFWDNPYFNEKAKVITDKETGTTLKYKNLSPGYADITHTQRGKSDKKGGAFRNFNKLVSQYDAIGSGMFVPQRAGIGPTPWARLVHMFPQMKNRIQKGLETMGDFRIDDTEMSFRSLVGLKKDYTSLVRQMPDIETFVENFDNGPFFDDMVSIENTTTQKVKGKGDSVAGFRSKGLVPNFFNPIQSLSKTYKRVAGGMMNPDKVVLMNKVDHVMPKNPKESWAAYEDRHLSFLKNQGINVRDGNALNNGKTSAVDGFVPPTSTTGKDVHLTLSEAKSGKFRNILVGDKFIRGPYENMEDDSPLWGGKGSPFENPKKQTIHVTGHLVKSKAKGLIPNFYNLNRRNLSDGDKMSDRQKLLKMWQDKMAEVKTVAKSGKPRTEIDPIISKKNAEANEIWEQIQKCKKGLDYYIPNYVDLEKVKQLAIRGVGGEKENAQRILNKRTIKSKNMFHDIILDAFLDNPNQDYPPGTSIIDHLITPPPKGLGYDEDQIRAAAKNPQGYRRAAKGLIPNFENVHLKRGQTDPDAPLMQPSINPMLYKPILAANTPEEVYEKLMSFMQAHATGHFSGRSSMGTTGQLGKKLEDYISKYFAHSNGSFQSWEESSDPFGGKWIDGEGLAENEVHESGMMSIGSGAVSFTTRDAIADQFHRSKKDGGKAKGKIHELTVPRKNIFGKKKLLRMLNMGAKPPRYPMVDKLKGSIRDGSFFDYWKGKGGLFINIDGERNDRSLIDLDKELNQLRPELGKGEIRTSMFTRRMPTIAPHIERESGQFYNEQEVTRIVNKGLVPNFAKLTSRQVNKLDRNRKQQRDRVEGKREFLGDGLTDYEKGLADSIFDYFLSNISGLSQGFRFDPSTLSLRATASDFTKIFRHTKSSKNQQILSDLAGGNSRLVNKILNNYMMHHTESMLHAKGQYKLEPDPLMQGAMFGGLVPSFSNPLMDAINREKAAGIPSHRIKIEKSSQLRSPQNPAGLAVTNTRDEPGGVAQGIRRAKMMKIDPKKHGAAKGLVPNFSRKKSARDAKLQRRAEKSERISQMPEAQGDSVPAPAAPVDTSEHQEAHDKMAQSIISSGKEYSAGMDGIIAQLGDTQEDLDIKDKINNFKKALDNATKSFEQSGDAASIIHDTGLQAAKKEVDMAVVSQAESSDPKRAKAGAEARKGMREMSKSTAKAAAGLKELDKTQESSLQNLFFMQSAISLVNGQLQEFAETGGTTTKALAAFGMGLSNTVASFIQAKELGGMLSQMAGNTDERGRSDGTSFTLGNLFGEGRQERLRKTKTINERLADKRAAKQPGFVGRQAMKGGGLGKAFTMIGNAGKVFGTVSKFGSRLIPVVGQLYTGFTAVNEIFKLFNDGEGIMSLFESASTKASKKIEKLGVISESAASALEAVKNNAKIQDELVELELKGAARTRTENERYLDLQVQSIDAKSKETEALSKLTDESVVGKAGLALYNQHMNKAGGTTQETVRALQELQMATKMLTMQQQQVVNFGKALDGADGQSEREAVARRQGAGLAFTLDKMITKTNADGSIDEAATKANIDLFKNFSASANRDGFNVDFSSFGKQLKLNDGISSDNISVLLHDFYQTIEDATVMDSEAGENRTTDAFMKQLGKQLGTTGSTSMGKKLFMDDTKHKKTLQNIIDTEKKRLDLIRINLKHQNAMNKLGRDMVKAQQDTVKSLGLMASSSFVLAEEMRMSADIEAKTREGTNEARLKFSESLMNIIPKTLDSGNLGTGLEVRGKSSENAVKHSQQTFNARMTSVQLMSRDDIEKEALAEINKNSPQELQVTDISNDQIESAKKLLDGILVEVGNFKDAGSMARALGEIGERLTDIDVDPFSKAIVMATLKAKNVVQLTTDQEKDLAKGAAEYAKALINIKNTEEAERKKLKQSIRQLNIQEKTVSGALSVAEDIKKHGDLNLRINEGLMGEAAHLKVINDALKDQGKTEIRSKGLRAKIAQDLLKQSRDTGRQSRDAMIGGGFKTMALSNVGSGPELSELQKSLSEQIMFKVGEETTSAEFAAKEVAFRSKIFEIQGIAARNARAKVDTELINLKLSTQEMAEKILYNQSSKKLNETVALQLQQEIMQAIESKKTLELRREALNKNSQRYMLAMSQHDTEMEELRASVQNTKDKLAIATLKGDIRKQAELQLEEELANSQKSGLIAAQNELILSGKSQLAEKIKRANELQEMTNKVSEMRLAKDKAFVDQKTLEVNARASDTTSKLSAFSEMRTAGTKASMTGNADDLLAAAQAQVAYNRALTGTTSALDQVNVELANIEVAASNLGSDLVSTAFSTTKTELKNVFHEIAGGTKTIGDAFKDMGLNVASALADRLMDHNIDSIMKNLTFAFTGKKPQDEAEKMRNAMQNAHLYHVEELRKQAKDSSTELGAILKAKMEEVNLDINIEGIDIEQIEGKLNGFVKKLSDTFTAGSEETKNDLGKLLGKDGLVALLDPHKQALIDLADSNKALALAIDKEATKRQEEATPQPPESKPEAPASSKLQEDLLAKQRLLESKKAELELANNKPIESVLAQEGPIKPEILNDYNRNLAMKRSVEGEITRVENTALGPHGGVDTERLAKLNDSLTAIQMKMDNLAKDHPSLLLNNQDKPRPIGSREPLVIKPAHERYDQEIFNNDFKELNQRLGNNSGEVGKLTTEINNLKTEIANLKNALQATKPITEYEGGKIQKYHQGGFVRGYKKGGEVPAILQEGEYVIPRKLAKGGPVQFKDTQAGALFTGIGQIGVSAVASDLANKWWGDKNKVDPNKPTFDTKRFNTLGLDSDVNMRANDSRLSARFRAENQATQDYGQYLLDMEDYKNQKINEKFQKRMGYLSQGLALFGSTAANFAVKGLTLASSAALDGVRNLGGSMGIGKKENVAAYKAAKAQGLDINYSQVAELNKKAMATGEKPSFAEFQKISESNAKRKAANRRLLNPVNLFKSNKKGNTDSGATGKKGNVDNDTTGFFARIFGTEAEREAKKNRKNDLVDYYQGDTFKKNAGGQIPAMLTKGEAVIPSAIASRIGYDNLNKMNTTGDFPIVDGKGGIDNVGPVGMNPGDFVIRKSSTDKLQRTNPNLMRFAAQNPDGFRRAAKGYYNGGIVDSELTYPSQSMGGGSYGTRQSPELSPQPETGGSGSTSGSSGGAVTNNINVNVTIDKSGGEVSTESNDTQGEASSYNNEKQLSQKIKAAVLDVIRQEKRVGGELS